PGTESQLECQGIIIAGRVRNVQTSYGINESDFGPMKVECVTGTKMPENYSFSDCLLQKPDVLGSEGVLSEPKFSNLKVFNNRIKVAHMIMMRMSENDDLQPFELF